MPSPDPEKRRAHAATYRERHREQRRAADRARYAAHGDTRRTYYAAHREARLSYRRARWAAMTPELRRATRAAGAANEKAAKHGAAGRLSPDELLPLVVRPCHYCGRPPGGHGRERVGIDHVIPLARRGPNELANLVPCCVSCNSSKGNRTPEEWRPYGP